MTMKPQIHWSHLSMMLRCGEQYRRRYVEGDICRPGVALVIGSATHASVDMNMRAKLIGPPASIEAVAECARDAVDLRWETEGVALEEDEHGRGEAVIRGEAVDTAVALSVLHHRDLAPGISPGHVERPWVIELQGFPRDLAGRIDLQEMPVGRSKAGRIREVKTCRRTPPPTAADDSDQLTMYALASKVLDGEISEVCMDALVKLKTPKAFTFRSRRSDDDLKVMLRRIERFSEALDRGVFLRADQANWVCNPKYCGYADTCPYHRRRTVEKGGS